MEETYLQLDRKAVTKATELDIMMDETTDIYERNDIFKEYCRFLRRYDLFEKPFVEDATLTPYEEDPEVYEYATIEEMIADGTLSGINEVSTFGWHGLHGIKSLDDRVMIPPRYERLIIDLHFSPTVYGCKDDKWGVIMLNGKVVGVPDILFDAVPEFIVYANWIKGIVGRKQGIFDLERREWILKPEYDELIHEGSHSCIITKKGSKYGFFDKDFTIPAEYDEVKLGRVASFVRFIKNGRTGYVSETGAWDEDMATARMLSLDPMYMYDRRFSLL